MVVEDYGTPNHGNSPLHNQEFLIQQSNDIHQPRISGDTDLLVNDYAEMYPVDGSLQEAPIRSTLDSKQMNDYAE